MQLESRASLTSQISIRNRAAAVAAAAAAVIIRGEQEKERRSKRREPILVLERRGRFEWKREI